MIYKALIKDVPDIVKLGFEFYEESLKEYGLSFDEATLIKTVTYFVKNSITLICIENEKTVGVISAIVHPSIFDEKEIFAEELMWYVNKENRNGRAGLELLKEFTNVCKKKGVSKIIMMHMENLNADIMDRLYKKKGYKKMESHFIGGI